MVSKFGNLLLHLTEPDVRKVRSESFMQSPRCWVFSVLKLHFKLQREWKSLNIRNSSITLFAIKKAITKVRLFCTTWRIYLSLRRVCISTRIQCATQNMQLCTRAIICRCPYFTEHKGINCPFSKEDKKLGYRSLSNSQNVNKVTNKIQYYTKLYQR